MDKQYLVYAITWKMLQFGGQLVITGDFTEDQKQHIMADKGPQECNLHSMTTPCSLSSE